VVLIIVDFIISFSIEDNIYLLRNVLYQC